MNPIAEATGGVYAPLMNPLASELNASLDRSVAGRLLSPLGRQMYFPKGIVAQTAEANQRAHRFNATVGMAYEGGEPMALSGLLGLTVGLSPTEAVAYAPTAGVPELRSLWKEEMLHKNPSLAGVETTLPVVTSGLTNGLFQVAELFVGSGDALVLPELFWGNYRLMMEVRLGADVVTYPLFDPAGGFNVGGLLDAIGSRPKAVVLLNFPNNPTGYSPTVEEVGRIVAELVRIAERGCDLLVICDDAYFGLLYEDGLFGESLFGPLSVAHERILAVKVDGATKEEFAWGFRVGFVTFAGRGLDDAARAALERKMMGSIRATVSNNSSIGQNMLVRAFRTAGYREEKAQKRLLLAQRYREVRRILERGLSARLKPLPFNSGYFMAFDCLGISAESLRLALLDKGIGTIAIGERYLRVAFSIVDLEHLDELYREISATADALAS